MYIYLNGANLSRCSLLLSLVRRSLNQYFRVCWSRNHPIFKRLRKTLPSLSQRKQKRAWIDTPDQPRRIFNLGFKFISLIVNGLANSVTEQDGCYDDPHSVRSKETPRTNTMLAVSKWGPSEKEKFTASQNRKLARDLSSYFWPCYRRYRCISLDGTSSVLGNAANWWAK
jgi:hypothetical protein